MGGANTKATWACRLNLTSYNAPCSPETELVPQTNIIVIGQMANFGKSLGSLVDVVHVGIAVLFAAQSFNKQEGVRPFRTHLDSRLPILLKHLIVHQW